MYVINIVHILVILYMILYICYQYHIQYSIYSMMNESLISFVLSQIWSNPVQTDTKGWYVVSAISTKLIILLEAERARPSEQQKIVDKHETLRGIARDQGGLGHPSR